jgi:hypothetical protein
MSETTVEKSKNKFTCQYCRKDFLKESTLVVHVCEQKKRRQEQNEKGVQLGLQAYLRFYEITQGSAKLKTFDDFADSSYYKAFVKFGRYIVSINAVNPARFIDWVINQNKKLDRWCSDAIYSEYLHEYLRRENIADALSRAIEYSIDWSEKTGHPAHDVLRYGNDNTLSYAVNTGRISPWVVYNCTSGQEFLARLNEDQLKLIWQQIDPEVWNKKFAEYTADQEYAKEILRKAGW